MQVNADPVTRAHQQVLAEIGVHGGETRCRKGPGEQRIGRRLRHTAPRYVSPVDGLLTAEDVVVTRAGIERAGVLVKGPAVDGHRRAVHRGAAAEALELRDIAWPVELQLHEGRPRVPADVTWRLRVRGDEIVRVRVRHAGVGELGSRLVVTQREPEPERRMQLEVPGRAARSGRVWLLLRIRRQRDGVGHVVARAGYT